MVSWKRWAFALIVVVASATGARSQPAGPQITWRVENPFRFFTDPADTEVHRATYLSLSDAERRAPVLNAGRGPPQPHPPGGGGLVGGQSGRNAEKNRVAFPRAKGYINPPSP